MNRERALMLSRLFSKNEKLTLAILVFFQIMLGLLDLIGVALIGGISLLALGGESLSSTPSIIELPLNLIGVSEANVESQILILGSIAIAVLTLKTFFSIIITKRIFRFLAAKSASLVERLAEIVFFSREEVRRDLKNQDIAYSLTTGAERAVLGIIGSGLSVISDLSLCFILFLGLVSINTSLALFALIFFVVVGFITHRITSNKTSEISSSLIKANNLDSRIIIESKVNIRDLIIRGRREAVINKVVMSRRNASNFASELAFLPYVGKYAIESSIVIGILLLIVTQFVFSTPGTALATISFFIGASSRIAPAVLRVQQGILQLSVSEGLSEGIFQLLKINSIEVPVEKPTSHAFDGSDVEVRIQDLQFTYCKDNFFSLSIPIFSVNKGDRVAVVGKSGSGKSTFLDLCLGLLEPSQGYVTISGVSPTELIRNHPGYIGFVPQDVSLVEGTIRENLLLGFENDAFLDEILWEVLYLSVLEDFVKELPFGIDTHISEWGTNLSGGQKQRIGIARMLLTRPRIIFFDEATSALDATTESLFHLRTKELLANVTVISVAHKLSTMRQATRIVLFDEGIIKGVGSFDELYDSNLIFQSQIVLMENSN